GLGILPIGLRKITPLKKRNPQSNEVARGNKAKPGTEIFPAALTLSALDRELQSEFKETSIAPRGHHADRGTFHSGQRAYSVRGLLVEFPDLLHGAAIRNQGQAGHENVRGFKRGLRLLQREQCLP